MTSLNVKIQIPNSSWNEITGKNIKLVASGTCKVCEVEDALLLLIGDITFAIKKEMPVVLQSKKSRMVFTFRSEKDELLYGLCTAKSPNAQEFTTILRDMMCLEETTSEDEKEEKESSCKIQSFGNKLASVISKGGKIGMDFIDKGSEKTKDGLDTLTAVAKEKVPTTDKTVEVPSEATAKIETAKKVTGVAVTISAALLSRALEAANTVATQFDPAVCDYLEKKGLKKKMPITTAAINVGKTTVKTAFDLYLALREASLALIEDTLDATADIIEHRYGADSGLAAMARDIAQTAENAIDVSENIGAPALKKVIQALDSDEDEKEVEQKEAAKVLADKSALGME